MPLPIAHSLVGASSIVALHPKPANKYYAPLLVGVVLANCPDVDFSLVFILHLRAWHRAFTHSLMFALVVGFAIFLILGRRQIRTAVAFGLAFLSHGVLDYMTTKTGGGVELFWPFSAERFGLGLVGLSELPSRLPPVGILKALLLELAIFLPLFVVVVQLKHYFTSSRRTTS